MCLVKKKRKLRKENQTCYISQCTAKNSKNKKQLWSDIETHRLDIENRKNSPNGFNTMLRTYYVQKFAAKTRVKILNSMKGAVMLKAHTHLLIDIFAIQVVICYKDVTKNLSLIIKIFHE